MTIEVGVDVAEGKVKLSLTTHGLTSSNTMSPRVARLVADQLISSADNIDKHYIKEENKDE